MAPRVCSSSESASSRGRLNARSGSSSSELSSLLRRFVALVGGLGGAVGFLRPLPEDRVTGGSGALEVEDAKGCLKKISLCAIEKIFARIRKEVRKV